VPSKSYASYTLLVGRTIYIRRTYGIFGRNIAKYTVVYGQVSHSCQKFCPNAEKYIKVSRTLSYIYVSTPAHSVFWREAPRWTGWTWVEIPAKRSITKSSSPVPEKTRGVLNNIPDILVKVRGSGVKFRFWTPFDPTFGRETCQIYEKMTQSKSSDRPDRTWKIWGCQKGVLEGVQ